MNIWLINPYGPIPTEAWRDYSFTMMGESLAQAGHQVIWWTSNYAHHFKRYRARGWSDLLINPHFTVRLVPTTSYTNNVGPGRILRDAVFATRTYDRGKRLPAPDCIVTAESVLTFGYAGHQLGRHHRCPVIYDQMDLWPELFETAVPPALNGVMHACLSPVYRSRRRLYQRLDGVMALAKSYLDIPLAEAPELQTRPHALVYNGIDVQAFRALMDMPLPDIPDLPEKRSDELWAVFAGSLGPSYDIPTIVEVAQRCAQSGLPLRFILAGDGPYRLQLEQASRTTANISYIGFLATKHLSGLYRHCDIALSAYTSRSNVEMPDKFYDYTAAGLPIINSLTGEVSEIIRTRQLGLQYTAGDVESLYAALQQLCTDNALRIAMAEHSADIAMEYDRHTQYARFVQLVETVVQQHKRRMEISSSV